VPEIGEIRGLGAMIGVEFVKDRETKEPDPDIVGRIVNGSTERGVVSVRCGIYRNVVRHLVPLVITDEQLAEGLDVLAETALSARA
jgi:4-aminobutyrate aminotransferase/(S)-3-amino-2-methylpropionate transaminase